MGDEGGPGGHVSNGSVLPRPRYVFADNEKREKDMLIFFDAALILKTQRLAAAAAAAAFLPVHTPPQRDYSEMKRKMEAIY